MTRLSHEFPPFFAPDSRVLILGSFPSVKSREQKFYYGHPQNRFWKVMTLLFESDKDHAEGSGHTLSDDDLMYRFPLSDLSDYKKAEEILRALGCPRTKEEKAAFASRHKIALWDVIESCEIEGSADSSIRSAVSNDLSRILPGTDIRSIFVNGGTAWRLFEKHMMSDALRLGIAAQDIRKLPSTSPANAAWSLPRLLEVWSIVAEARAR